MTRIEIVERVVLLLDLTGDTEQQVGARLDTLPKKDYYQGETHA